VLTVYTIVTGLMWWATKKAAQTAEKSAEIAEGYARMVSFDQRPWMFMSLPDTLGVKDGRIEAKPPLLFLNNGGAFAYVQMACWSGYIDGSQTFLPDVRRRLDKEIPPNAMQVLIGNGKLEPGVPAQPSAPIECIQLAKGDNGSGNDLAMFGTIDYATAGRVTPDRPRKSYSTHFCFYQMLNGRVSFCHDTETNYVE